LGATTDESDEHVNQLAASAVIESVQPALVTPTTDTFTIRGTVTNTGTEPLINLQVLPRWGWEPVADRDEVQRVFDDPDYPFGPSYGTSQRYGDDFDVEFAGDVEPGQSVSFELEFDNDNLNDPDWFSTAGVYVIGVDVRAGADENDRPTYDTARTLITWLPGDDELPQVPVAMVWPVTARPSIMAEGEFLDDTLATQVSGDGRLETLVTAARTTSAPLSWLVDPDVLTTVDAMTSGYQVRSGDGLEAGAGVGDAAAWRDDFDIATASDEVHLLPATQPDVESVLPVDAQLATRLVDEAVELARTTADANPGWKSGITWFDTETVDPDVLSEFSNAGVNTVLVRPSAVTGTAPVSELETTAEATALVTDSRLDQSFVTDRSSFDLEQQWRAETAVVALEALATGDLVAPIITAPPQYWSPNPAQAAALLGAWTSADWIRPVTLDQARSIGVSTGDELVEHTGTPGFANSTAKALVRLDSDQQAYSSLLAGGQVESAESTEDSVELESAAPDDQDSDETAETDVVNGALSVLRTSSLSWRAEPDAQTRYISLVSDDFRDVLSGVKVIARDSVTLTSSSGEFPLTIENSLDVPVTVSLRVLSSNSDRLTIGDVPEQTVGPGEKVTVPVSAEAKANGRVPVTVQLVNANGDRIGPLESVYVNAAEYGRIAWVIVGGAGLLFGAGLVRRVVRGKTRTKNDDSLGSSSDEPVEKVAQ
jgi:hypothetical protein